MITYEPSKKLGVELTVKLEGKVVGFIIRCNGGFVYKSKSGLIGDKYPSIDGVKLSLENDE